MEINEVCPTFQIPRTTRARSSGMAVSCFYPSFSSLYSLCPRKLFPLGHWRARRPYCLTHGFVWAWVQVGRLNLNSQYLSSSASQVLRLQAYTTMSGCYCVLFVVWYGVCVCMLYIHVYECLNMCRCTCSFRCVHVEA